MTYGRGTRADGGRTQASGVYLCNLHADCRSQMIRVKGVGHPGVNVVEIQDSWDVIDILAMLDSRFHLNCDMDHCLTRAWKDQ
jgi:hypothetical protein